MNAKRIQRLLGIAYPLCLDNPRPKKHISIILRKGSVEAIGSNVMKTHPMAVQHGYLFGEMHSELDAFLKVNTAAKRGLVLFNVRFNRFGQMRMARPCVRCMPWCVGCFDEIWYTTDAGVMLHGEGLTPINIGIPKEKLHEKVHPIS
jgi:hypothetical protein